MLSDMQNRKDTVQVLTESAAAHVGRIASIVTGAVRAVTTEVGDWLSDVIEIREAAQRSQRDHHAAPSSTVPSSTVDQKADQAD